MIFRMGHPLTNDHLDEPAIRMERSFANHHSDGPASCKWFSGSTDLLQTIIRIDRPLANDHLDGPASCKWSSFSFSVILLLCKSIFSFSKYFPPLPPPPTSPPSSSRTRKRFSFSKPDLPYSGFRDWPLANDLLDQPASYKWPSELTGPLQMIIWMDRPLANDNPDGPASWRWSSGWTGLL